MVAAVAAASILLVPSAAQAYTSYSWGWLHGSKTLDSAHTASTYNEGGIIGIARGEDPSIVAISTLNSGGPHSQEFEMPDGTVATNPQLAINDEDEAVAVWTETTSTDSTIMMSFRPKAVSGQYTWGDPIAVTNTGALTRDFASVALNDDHRAAVVWTQSDGDNVRVQERVYDGENLEFFDAGELSGTMAVNENARTPLVQNSYNEDGGSKFVVAWLSTNSDDNDTIVYGSDIVSDDGTVGSAEVLQDGGFVANDLRLGAATNGAVVAAWAEFTNASNFTEQYWTVKTATAIPELNVTTWKPVAEAIQIETDYANIGEVDAADLELDLGSNSRNASVSVVAVNTASPTRTLMFNDNVSGTAWSSEATSLTTPGDWVSSPRASMEDGSGEGHVTLVSYTSRIETVDVVRSVMVVSGQSVSLGMVSPPGQSINSENLGAMIIGPFAIVMWNGPGDPANMRWSALHQTEVDADVRPVTNLAATPADGAVTLTWAAAAEGDAAERYDVVVDGETVCTVNAPGLTCTVTGLTNGTETTFAVIAYANDAASVETTISATPVATVTPPVSVIDVVLGFNAGDSVSGATTTVSASGLQANSAWTLTMYSTPRELKSGFADANGYFSAVVSIPLDTPVGSHRLILRGIDANGDAISKIAYFSVAADGTIGAISYVTDIAEELPPTGVDAGAPITGALLLLMLGATLFVTTKLVIRRRKTA